MAVVSKDSFSLIDFVATRQTVRMSANGWLVGWLLSTRGNFGPVYIVCKHFSVIPTFKFEGEFASCVCSLCYVMANKNPVELFCRAYCEFRLLET